MKITKTFDHENLELYGMFMSVYYAYDIHMGGWLAWE